MYILLTYLPTYYIIIIMVFYFSPKGHSEGEQTYLIYMGRDK